MKLQWMKTSDHTLPVPTKMTSDAAGLDIRANLPASKILIRPGERKAIPTGYKVAIPSGYEIQVRPRSGNALNFGITVLNAPGTIDADYRGELLILLINHSEESYCVTHGERIAQLVVTKVEEVESVLVSSLDETTRGANGFGSTGIN